MAQQSNGGCRRPTKAELRILRLLARGLTRKEVADRLGLSGPAGVDFHLRNLRKRLAVTTLGSIVYRAVEEGWLVLCDAQPLLPLPPFLSPSLPPPPPGLRIQAEGLTPGYLRGHVVPGGCPVGERSVRVNALMRAVVYAGAGGPEVLRLEERAAPTPGDRQVRVRVRAAGLNRADILQRRGGYPAPPGWPADIPGLEYAGEVELVGPGVSRWQVGDRAMGLVGGGAHAEVVVVHEDEVIPVPSHLSFTDAAAIPEAFLTAYDALVTRARVRAGDRVLVHAVGSGLGLALVQVAKLLGAMVIGTSRTADKLARAAAYGLDQGINTAAGAFPASLSAPVEVVIDVLGGPAFAGNLVVLAPRGRLVLLGFLQGPEAPARSLAPILRKRQEVIGSVMRARGAEERAALAQEFTAQLLPAFAPPAALRPVVDSTYSMADIVAAHRAMESNTTFGKVVLTW